MAKQVALSAVRDIPTRKIMYIAARFTQMWRKIWIERLRLASLQWNLKKNSMEIILI